MGDVCNLYLKYAILSPVISFVRIITRRTVLRSVWSRSEHTLFLYKV